MSSNNLRQKILASDDLTRQPLHIPEWDTDVYLRVLTLRERQQLARLSRESENNAVEVSARVCIMCMVDEHGAKVFEDSDVELLLDKNGAIVERITGEILTLNGLNETAVDEAEKN